MIAILIADNNINNRNYNKKKWVSGCRSAVQVGHCNG